MSEQAGYELSFDLLPAPRMISSMGNNHSDVTLLVTIPALRDLTNVDMSEQSVGDLVLNVYTKDPAIQISEREHFRDYRVAVMAGYGSGATERRTPVGA